MVLVDCGSKPEVGRRLAAAYAAEDRVHYYRLPADSLFSTAANFAFAQTSGAQVVFLSGRAVPRPGWLTKLRLAKSVNGHLGAQPLLTQQNGAVLSAGHAFLGGKSTATPLLYDFNSADAPNADLTHLSAVSREVFITDADTFCELRSFNPMFADEYEDLDFCLRAYERFGHTKRGFSCAHESIVELDTPARSVSSRRSEENLRVFSDRWDHWERPDDSNRYSGIGIAVRHLLPSSAGGRRPTHRSSVSGERRRNLAMLRQTGMDFVGQSKLGRQILRTGGVTLLLRPIWRTRYVVWGKRSWSTGTMLDTGRFPTLTMWCSPSAAGTPCRRNPVPQT